MSKNLFETYKVNGRTYTDNLGINAMISIPKKQYIEYEQQKEEIERLHSIIKEVREYANEITKKYWSDDGRAIIAEKVLEILDKENV